MKYHSILAALFMAAALPAAAQVTGSDHMSTSDGTVDIVPIQHAAIRFDWKDQHVFTDPAPIGDAKGDAAAAPYKAMPSPTLILITHVHGDHFSVPVLESIAGGGTVIVAPQNVRDAMPAALQAKTRVMKNGDKAMFGPIGVEAVAMYNVSPDKLKFHPKGVGNGYVLTFANKRVYVAGDTEETPETASLPNIDIAFIPINLPYTEDVAAAARWVKDFKPRIVFPYHYRNQDGTTSDMAAFLNQVGNASLVRLRNRWYQPP